ncbi:VOC family protein [Blastococcus sp. CT_GayMR16]|uniref:VOC family protein n=1 Tax=Blastococcus sp. CT_GayMR16 TaxID=2559607 RepID=UPI0010746527|nr:VOC family protein [Blastococcus sp. CT_GayMR16]TFV91451.1 VOC family protein [Blastococcus sp. CT_GayMR16]
MLKPATSLNHIAMPTNNTAETYRFYTKVMGFKLKSAVREERVPSTGDETPFLHTFFALEDGSCMAFFDIAGEQFAGRSDGVPSWIRHFAFNVETYEELLSWKARLEENGISVLGVIDHEGIWQSIYFFDPNGLRLELTWQKRELEPEDTAHGEELVRQWIEEFNQKDADEIAGDATPEGAEPQDRQPETAPA